MYLWNKPSPSLAGLAGVRPNQAMSRVYAGWTAPRAPIGPVPPGLGAFGDTSDPTTWIVGGAALLGLFLLFRGGGGSSDKRRIARLASQRALASRSLREEGAA